MSNPTDTTAKLPTLSTPAVDWKTVGAWLDAAASAADAAQAVLPAGPAQLVDAAVSAALKFAADLAASGQDPAVAIARVHAADASLAGVEDAWQRELDARFPPAAPAPATVAQFFTVVRAAGIVIPAELLALAPAPAAPT